jgi:hypothetical protein
LNGPRYSTLGNAGASNKAGNIRATPRPSAETYGPWFRPLATPNRERMPASAFAFMKESA